MACFTINHASSNISNKSVWNALLKPNKLSAAECEQAHWEWVLSVFVSTPNIRQRVYVSK